MTDKVQKIREEVKRLKSQLLRGACSSQIAMETMCKEEAYNEVLTILDTMQEEPVSEDLDAEVEHYIRIGGYDGLDSEMEVKKIANHFANWQKEQEYTCYEEAFEDGATWKVENLWKPADGDDLPEINREVVAFQETFPTDVDVPSLLKIVIAHRPNPDGWDGKNLATGEVIHYTPKTYGKGGWNLENIVYWLDAEIPKHDED